jgi:flagellar motor switch protein FliG
MKNDMLRRAAVLVSSLDTATADALLDQLPEEDAARVRRLVVEIEEVDADEQRAVLDDFRRGRRQPSAGRDARHRRHDSNAGVELDPGLARRLSQRDYAGDATTAGGSEERPFRFLQAARSEKLSPLLTGEHPQTIAVVVSHLPDDRAAALLATLEGELQADVLRRLISLDQADPEMLREVERGLESRMLEHALVERRREAGFDAVERILDAATPAARRTILSNLAVRDEALASRLRPRELDFDDVGRLDDFALATVLSAADAEITRLALAGADVALVNRILGRLPAAEARQARRKIEKLGPTRLSDVEGAQREIARVANDLLLQGKIDYPEANSRWAA